MGPVRLGFTMILQLDLSGCVLVLCSVICYLLALQWGGLQKPWSDSTVIGTLVGFLLLSGLCVANEIYIGERASIVPRLMKNRRIFLNQAVVFFNSGGLFVLVYYLPLYFQSIKNDGPLQSGVHNLPFLIGGIFSMISGVVLSTTNQWVPFLVVSAALSAVGSGLIYTFGPDTPMDKWVGYQILAGGTIGFLSQIPIMANTSVVDMSDMSTISAMTLFFQLIGGSFSVSAAQAAFSNTLLSRMRETAPDLSSSMILGVGASEQRSVFTPNQIPGILEAYMDALKAAFALATALLAISALISLVHKWEKLRPDQLATTIPAYAEKKNSGDDSESTEPPVTAKSPAIMA
ncbi:unnamed protein product [Clonostachys rosea]|uniref:Major facilitator superfamily (MFS) profile domain-containing protein n=1 Tax=Bionectria ochroleuca TaxID=29856 RepID=A0ABY6ULU0_BIOOC|nr:unnamed protein product [Clonostachys rosea]